MVRYSYRVVWIAHLRLRHPFARRVPQGHVSQWSYGSHANRWAHLNWLALLAATVNIWNDEASFPTDREVILAILDYQRSSAELQKTQKKVGSFV